MTREDDKSIAEKIVKIAAANEDATVAEIAAELEETEEDVTRILDEYHVTDGKPTHRGPGRGGGWTQG